MKGKEINVASKRIISTILTAVMILTLPDVNVLAETVTEVVADKKNDELDEIIIESETKEDEADNDNDISAVGMYISESDYVGLGTELSPFLIHNIDELKGMFGIRGQYYWKLVDDIYLNPDTKFTPGVVPETWSLWEAKDFSGYFDGNNHVIHNLYSEYGLIRGLRSGSIKNLIIENYINESIGNYTGIIIEDMYENTAIKNCEFRGTGYSKIPLGGIVGRASASEITNCINNGNITSESSIAGIVSDTYKTNIAECVNGGTLIGKGKVAGIVVEFMGGYRGIYSEISISDCVNEGDLYVKEDENNYEANAAGIVYEVGEALYYHNQTININNCINKGSVNGRYASGVVYQIGEQNTIIWNCSNQGTVNASRESSGIVGTANGTVSIIRCYNSGTVIGSYEISGIANWIVKSDKNDNPEKSLVTECYNVGKVLFKYDAADSGSDPYMSGLINHAHYVDIDKCYNVSDLTCLYKEKVNYATVSGLINLCDDGSISNSFNRGNVKVLNETNPEYSSGYFGSGFASGIIHSNGTNNNKLKLAQCYNTGHMNTIGNYKGAICSNGYSEERYVLDNVYYLDNGDSPFADINSLYYEQPTQGCKKLSENQMKSMSNYKGWDFENTWEMGDDGYPVLQVKEEEDPRGEVPVEDIGLTSVMYEYGSVKKNILTTVHNIEKTHGAFSLTCQGGEEIKKYVLKSKQSIIAVSYDGKFKNIIPSKFVSGEKIYIETYGSLSRYRKELLLKIDDKVLNDVGFGAVKAAGGYANSISILGNGFKYKLDKDIPIIGGSELTLAMPKLPVTVEMSDGKVVIGINIKKQSLLSYDSISNKEEFFKKSKSWKEALESSVQSIKKDSSQTRRILKNWKSAMDNPKHSTRVPGMNADIDLALVGYAEAEWSDSLESIKGYIIASCEGKATLDGGTRYIPVGVIVIPITFNVECGANGEYTAELKFDNIDRKFIAKGTFGVSTYLEPYAGIGVGRWASVGWYGKGEVGATISDSSEDSDLDCDVYLYGETGLKVYAAKGTLTKVTILSMRELQKNKNIGKYVDSSHHLLLLSTTKPALIKGKGSKTTQSINSYSNNNSMYVGDLSDNDYLDEIFEYSDDVEATFYTTTSGEEIVSNAYGGASPEIITVNNKTYLFYIDNDSSRNSADQSVLKYSVLNSNGTWNTPQIINNDGTADFAPTVKSDGTNIYVAYQNSQKIFGAEEPNFDDYIGSFGVDVCKINTVTGELINIGRVNSESVYAYAQDLYCENGKVYLSWVENKDNNVFGLSGNNNIYICEIGNSEIAGDKKAVATNINSVSSLAISHGDMVFLEDTDNDLLTFDKKLHYLKFNDKIVDVRDDIIQEGNYSSLKYDKVGNMTNIAPIFNNDGKIAYISDGKINNISETPLLNTGTDFVVNSGNIYYLNTSDESRNIIKLAYSKGEWKTGKLTDEDEYVDSFSIDGDSLVYLLTDAKYNETTEEWDTKSSIKYITTADRTEIELADVYFDPTSLIGNSKLQLSLVMSNYGTTNVENIDVKITGKSGSVEVIPATVKMLPGEDGEVNVEMSLPSKYDANSIYEIEVVPSGYLGKPLTNNRYTLDLSKTDLSVESDYIIENDIPKLKSVITNNSPISSDATVSITSSDGKVVYTENVYVESNSSKEVVFGVKDLIPEDGSVENLHVKISTAKEQYYELNDSDSCGIYDIEKTKDENKWIPIGVQVSEPLATGYEYTGNAIKPKLYVTEGAETLVEGVDYTVTYANNIEIYDYTKEDQEFSASKAPSITVDVPATETREALHKTYYFRIIGKDISSYNTEVSNVTYEMTGKIINPKVTVKYDGNTLEEGIDYVLSYPEKQDGAYVNEGYYTILVTGIGKYTGTNKGTLEIIHTHSYVGDYGYDENYHYKSCICGDEGNYEEHDFTDWVILTPPTLNKEGVKSRSCTICKYVETTSDEPISYNITYVLNGGINYYSNPTEYMEGTEVILQDASRTGYRFDGWFDNEDFKGEALTKISSTARGDITLYAKWTELKTVTIINNYGGKVNGAGKYAVNEYATVSITNIPSEFKFLGWYDANNKLLSSKTEYTFIVTSDITLYVKYDVPDGLWYTANTENIIYSGEPIKPEISVYDGSKRLVLGKDYTVSYANNKNAASKSNAKAPSIVINGKGSYTKKYSKTFTINKKNLKDCRYLSYMTVLNNSKITPVIANNGILLKSSDYDMYRISESGSSRAIKSSDKWIDDGILRLVGKGNYEGSVDINVITSSSKPKVIDVALSKDKYCYDGNPGLPPITVFEKGDKYKSALREDSDYFIYEPDDTTNAGAHKFVVVGIGKYSGALQKSVTIYPSMTGALNAKATPSEVSFNGKGTVPENIKVTYRVTNWVDGKAEDTNTELVEGRDYTVKYSNNNSANSSAKYTVSFIGNFKGRKAETGSFYINKKKFDDAQVRVLIPDKTNCADKGVFKQSPVISVDGNKLSSKEYMITYYTDDSYASSKEMTSSNPVYIGSEGYATVYVKIEGQGNYSGEVKASYNVFKKGYKGSSIADLSKAKVTIKNPKNVMFVNKEVEPAIDRVVVGGSTVSPSYYTVSYAVNVYKGTASLMVTGDGIHAFGSKIQTFSIGAYDVNNIKEYTPVTPTPEPDPEPEPEPEPTKYTVKFNVNGGVGTYADQAVEEGKKATKPSNNPTKEGYTFKYWSKTNAEGAVEYNFDTIVTGNIILYAIYEKNVEPEPEPELIKYTVKFNTNGGTGTYTDQAVEEGKKATKPATNPTKEGYTFKYWSITNTEGATEYNFDTVVTGNITLYAIYEKNTEPESEPGTTKYTVKFDANGHGTAPDTLENVVKGSKITEPTEPTASGYTFGGWYKEISCINKWNFSKDSITSNVTLYAEWIESTTVASGKGTGTFEWRIDSEGCLYVSGEGDSNYSDDGPDWCRYNTQIRKAVVSSKKMTTMSHWFAKCNQLKEVKFENCDTSQVTNMHDLFYECYMLSNIYFNDFDTTNVTDMGFMFNSCNSLKNIDLSKFNTTNVTTMFGMFKSCHLLKDLDLSGFKTTNVADMGYMFEFCDLLENLNLSGIKTINVTNMDCMFEENKSLRNLDLSGFNTSNVESMMDMFSGCELLESLDLSSFNTSNCEYGMDTILEECTSLKEVKSPSSMKSGSYIAFPIGTKWHTETDNNPTNIDKKDETYYKTEGTDIASGTGTGTLEWKIDSEGCLYVTGKGNAPYYETPDMDLVTKLPKWCEYSDKIKYAVVSVTDTTTMTNWFATCENIKSIKFVNCDTSKVTDMSNMFYMCWHLRYLDLSGLNTENVTDMSNMFCSCMMLYDLDLSSFNTSKVTDMSGMFNYCSSVINIDLSNFNTSNVKDMISMFEDCNNLMEVDLRTFDTSKVRDVTCMFDRCLSLEELNLNSFDLRTAGANVDNMLSECDSLNKIMSPNNMASEVVIEFPNNTKWFTKTDINPSGIDKTNEVYYRNNN